MTFEEAEKELGLADDPAELLERIHTTGEALRRIYFAQKTQLELRTLLDEPTEEVTAQMSSILRKLYALRNLAQTKGLLHEDAPPLDPQPAADSVQPAKPARRKGHLTVANTDRGGANRPEGDVRH